MIRLNLRKPQVVPVVLLLILVILLGLGLLKNPNLFLNLKDFSLKAINFSKEKIDLNKSFAEVFLDGEKLVFKFDISPDDLEGAKSFSNALGLKDQKFLEGFSIDLDKSTKDKISSIFPNKLFLDFDGKKLKFKSSSISFLKSSLGKKDFKFATGSGKINLNYQNGQDFELNLEKPKDLVTYATISGNLSLSQKIDFLFPIAGKIAKIDLRVSGKTIEGEIELN